MATKNNSRNIEWTKAHLIEMGFSDVADMISSLEKTIEERDKDNKELAEELRSIRMFDGPNQNFSIEEQIAKIDSLQKYQYNLYGYVSSLHDAMTGASDPPFQGIPSAVARLIQRRLDVWTESYKGWEKYDNCMKGLCEAVLKEWESSSLKRNETAKDVDVQVNGTSVGSMWIPIDFKDYEAIERAKYYKKVNEALAGKIVNATIYRPGESLNFVCS